MCCSSFAESKKEKKNHLHSDKILLWIHWTLKLKKTLYSYNIYDQKHRTEPNARAKCVRACVWRQRVEERLHHQHIASTEKKKTLHFVYCFVWPHLMVPVGVHSISLCILFTSYVASVLSARILMKTSVHHFNLGNFYKLNVFSLGFTF